MKSGHHARRAAGWPIKSLCLIGAGVVIAFGAIVCSRMAYVESD
jgi:hypothetical protein